MGVPPQVLLARLANALDSIGLALQAGDVGRAEYSLDTARLILEQLQKEAP